MPETEPRITSKNCYGLKLFPEDVTTSGRHYNLFDRDVNTRFEDSRVLNMPWIMTTYQFVIFNP